MAVFCPKLVKAFKHSCFIPKLAFNSCLNGSCAPFITLLDIYKDSVGDVGDYRVSDLVSCAVLADTVPCTMFLPNAAP